MFAITDDTECHQAKGKKKKGRETAVDIIKVWLQFARGK